MKSKILTYALAIGCTVLAVLYLQQCGRANESDLLRDSAQSARIAERNHSLQEIRVRDRHIQAVLEDRDSVVRESALKISRLSEALNASKARLRPVTIINRGDTVELFTEVLKRDTVILKQDTVILTLEAERAKILRMDSIAFDSLKANVMQFQGLFESEAKETVKLESKLEKEKRKRFSIGPAVGYGISRDGLSPNVSISIQYRLFKF